MKISDKFNYYLFSSIMICKIILLEFIKKRLLRRSAPRNDRKGQIFIAIPLSGSGNLIVKIMVLSILS